MGCIDVTTNHFKAYRCDKYLMGVGYITPFAGVILIIAMLTLWLLGATIRSLIK